MQKMKGVTACAGVFYWEPQLYGWWKPAAYNKWGWNAYGKGAFTSQGRPSAALKAFEGDHSTVEAVIMTDEIRDSYDLSGRTLMPSALAHSSPKAGIYLLKGRKIIVH